MNRVGLCVASAEPTHFPADREIPPIPPEGLPEEFNPTRDLKCPDKAELELLKVGFVRTLVLDFAYFDTLLGRLPPGVKVIACLNRETRHPITGDPVGIDEVVEGGKKRLSLTRWRNTVEAFVDYFADRKLVHAVEVTNEWDTTDHDNHTAAHVVELIQEVTGVLRPAGIKVVTGGTAGGWHESITDLVALIYQNNVEIDGVGVHFYNQQAGEDPPLLSEEIDWAISTAHEYTKGQSQGPGYPLYLTEFGLKPNETRGYFGQGTYLTNAFGRLMQFDQTVLAAACWFAWSDEVGSPGQ